MLSKGTKVGVKNKENKTACFIEIEGLLNSPELISDLPGLETEEQQGRGAGRTGVGEKRVADRSRLCSGACGRYCGNVTVFRGAAGS